jgi:chromosome segregation ATPase
MSPANKALILMAVTIMGIWGCTQGPANGAAGVERIRVLEEKCAKLESDYSNLASAREQLSKKLTAAEEERDRIAQELDQQRGVARERDALRQQLQARTSERDAVQAQFDQFRSGIRNLLGQVEAASARVTDQPVSVRTDSSEPGKS